MKLGPGIQELLDVEGQFLVIIGCVFVVRVLGQIVFVGQEGPDTSQLQDALAAIQDSQLIPAHELLAQLLKVGSVAGTVAPCIRGVEGVNSFLAKSLREILQRGGFGPAQKDLRIHVADDGVRIVLVDGLQLGSGLQHQAGADLPGTDGGHQLFQVWDLANICRLINQTPHMHGKSAAIDIIGFLTQQVEQLGVDHADQEIEAAVRVRHHQKQGGLFIPQRVQLQLIIQGDLPDLLNIKGGQPGTGGHQDAF